MKSLFTKSSSPHSSPADTSVTRRNVFLAVVALIVVAFFIFPSITGSSSSDDGSPLRMIRRPFPEVFRIAIIADLDKRSKDASGKLWHSIYMTGTLHRKDEAYEIEWDAPADVSTAHNEATRGAELSELVLFQRHLLTFDDRTGLMFEVVNFADSGDSKAAPAIVPRHILSEGNGVTDKGMKIEWATVKGDLLYVGSFGKEFTDNGIIKNSNNLWIKTVNKEGASQSLDWKANYDAMRAELGYEHPAYLLHEAITWSPHHKRWFVLPRRISKEPYDDVVDERKGANTIITASADFTDIRYTTVGRLTPERGFSSFKFLPGSADTIILALKSAEDSAADKQTSFLTIFKLGSDGQWRVLMPETEIPGGAKFEGIEVLDPIPDLGA